MRNILQILMAGLFALGTMGISANAAETAANTATDAAPVCMPVQLDGQTTQACFGLTQEQAEGLQTQAGTEREEIVDWHHCEVRCMVVDHFGRCIRWHRVCW